MEEVIKMIDSLINNVGKKLRKLSYEGPDYLEVRKELVAEIDRFKKLRKVCEKYIVTNKGESL